jgi:hypothetical protein
MKNIKDLNLELDSVNYVTLNKNSPGCDEPPEFLPLLNYQWHMDEQSMGKSSYSVEITGYKYVLVKDKEQE